MEYRTTVAVNAPAEAVWATLAALREWPAWTPTVESVDTDQDFPAVGQRIRVKQPRRKVVRYVVDVVEPGRRFRWGTDRLGVRQSADHVVTAAGPHGCTVEVSFTMAGPVGSALGVLGAGKIRAMVDAEAAGLRAHVEKQGPGQAELQA